ncbi:hypothetical protein TcCL_Unassigned03118 [Trypanosoma cruzi]|nr:hypothetical protein TcCL_Unassigned03118 [Trypanosoma cruzi]
MYINVIYVVGASTEWIANPLPLRSPLPSVLLGFFRHVEGPASGPGEYPLVLYFVGGKMSPWDGGAVECGAELALRTVGTMSGIVVVCAAGLALRWRLLLGKGRCAFDLQLLGLLWEKVGG